MSAHSKFFKTQEAYDGVTAITGLIGELAFLVRGKEKALLIDTLTGVGSLKAFVRGLTDLPITVVNTHGHVDHVGSNAEFDCVYMHPLDIDMSYIQMGIAKKTWFLGWCLADLAKKGITPKDFVRERPYYVLPIEDGNTFDLGGKTLEVIHIPGHSRGSVALLDVQARVVFIGDAIGTGYHLENSTSVAEYLKSLKYFKTHAHRFDRMIWSHNNLEPLTPAQIDDNLELCHDVLEGRDDAVPHPAPPLFSAKRSDKSGKRLDGKWGHLAYDKKFIFQKERSKKVVDYATRTFNIHD